MLAKKILKLDRKLYGKYVVKGAVVTFSEALVGTLVEYPDEILSLEDIKKFLSVFNLAKVLGEEEASVTPTAEAAPTVSQPAPEALQSVTIAEETSSNDASKVEEVKQEEPKQETSTAKEDAPKPTDTLEVAAQEQSAASSQDEITTTASSGQSSDNSGSNSDTSSRNNKNGRKKKPVTR